MSTQRPVIQAIPPFKGAPLQPTDVQNRRPTAAEAYVALANRKAGANVVSTRATGSENYRPSHHAGSSHHASQRQQPVPAVDRRQPQHAAAPAPAAERPKPTSRLEREKKRHHNDPKNIGHWRLDKLIGQGASGRVRLAIHDQTGQRAAVKIIPRTLINASRMSLRDADVKANKMILGIEREIVIMKLIEHPNLLGLWDVYETSKDLFLIMEYVAGGELFDHLVAQGKLTPRDARAYFRQIIFGMDYCHRFNICHRDLKPENLLLDESKKIVKVADFGMAALQPTEKMLETSCGSPHYASPEIVSGKRYKGTASDIWSCGIILFALLCGRLPFDDPNIQQLLGKVRAGKFMMPEWLEPASKDLIWRMLEVDPEKRIKMADIMRHPWFTNNGKESSHNPVSTSLDTLQMEQLTHDTIDLDILGNLKTLWFELSEDDIVRELLSPGPSWQKTFYTLLVAHRENHSADDEDDMDDDIVNEQIVTASAVPAHAMLASSGAAKTLEIARPRRTGEGPGATSAPTSPRLESFDMERRHSTPEKGSAYNTVPVRATDVTPTKVASPHVRPANPSPRLRPSPLDSPATSLKAPFASPSKLQAPLPAQTTPPSGSPRRESDGSYVLPQISLQTASPQRNERPNVDLQRRNTSPTKAAPASAPPSARIALANLYDAPVSAHGAAASSSSSSSSSSAAAARSRANRGSGSEMMPPLALPGRASSRPVSPTKATFGAAATAAPAAPQPAAQPVLQRPSTARAHTTHAAPSIQVPQVGDATMQKFFQEIADELASIRATGEKPDALQSKIEQLKKSMALQQQPAATAAASSAPSTGGRGAGARGSEMNQFEDAEDDVSEGESMRSVSQASSHQQSYTPSTPMTPLSPAELIAPLSLTDKASARTSIASTVASSNASTRNSVRSARSATEASSSGGTSRPTSVFSNISTGSTGLGRKRSLLGLRRGGGDKHATQHDANTIRSIAYEQTAAPPALASIFAPPAGSSARPGAGSSSSSRAPKNLGLGLDMGAGGVGGAMGAISPPTTPVTAAVATLAPVPGGGAPGKKDSWFAGLFNWKPATFTLMSTDNFSETLNEVVRRLQSYGVRVAMDESSDVHHTTLRCSMSEYRESNGVTTAAKPLRFRVELNILPVGSAANSPAMGGGLGLSLHGGAVMGGGGLPSPALSTYSRGSSAGGVTFATSVLVVQEKGALSTFKLVHGRLRREWTLDLASAVV